MNNKEKNSNVQFNEKEFSIWYQNAFIQIALPYFLRKMREDPTMAEWLARDSLSKCWESIHKNKIPSSKWANTLRKILTPIWSQYCRDELYPQKKKVPLEDVADTISDEAAEIKSENDESLLRLGVWHIRSVLITKHRSLQEIVLVSVSKHCDKLKDLIHKKFPLVIGQYAERGIAYELIRKKNADEAEVIPAETLDETDRFNGFVFKVAKKLHVEDYIGLKALKILLLASNPWKEWCILARKIKTKDYLSLSRDGKLIRKPTVKRPNLHFFRDFLLLLGQGVKPLKEFIRYEATEHYPEAIVSEEYVQNWYKLGSINSDTLKKQKGGRSSRKGLKQKVEFCNSILEKIIQEFT